MADVGVRVVVGVECDVALRVDLEVHVAPRVVHADQQLIRFCVPRECDVTPLFERCASSRNGVSMSVDLLCVCSCLSSVRVGVASHSRVARFVASVEAPVDARLPLVDQRPHAARRAPSIGTGDLTRATTGAIPVERAHTATRLR